MIHTRTLPPRPPPAPRCFPGPPAPPGNRAPALPCLSLSRWRAGRRGLPLKRRPCPSPTGVTAPMTAAQRAAPTAGRTVAETRRRRTTRRGRAPGLHAIAALTGLVGVTPPAAAARAGTTPPSPSCPVPGKRGRRVQPAGSGGEAAGLQRQAAAAAGPGPSLLAPAAPTPHRPSPAAAARGQRRSVGPARSPTLLRRHPPPRPPRPQRPLRPGTC